MKLIYSNDAIKMEYFRQWPASKRSRLWAGWLVMIRSSGGLWRPKGQGYTNRKAEAGVFTLRDACARTFHCGPEKHVVFLALQNEVGDRIIPSQEAENWAVERAKWMTPATPQKETDT